MPITAFTSAPTGIVGVQNADAHIQQEKVGNGIADEINLVLGNILAGKVQFEFATFNRFEVNIPLNAVIHSAKVRYVSSGLVAGNPFNCTGGFLKPQGGSFPWEDGLGTKEWNNDDNNVPFGEWNNGNNTDNTVFHGNAPAFTSESAAIITTSLAEWSVGDGQSPTGITVPDTDLADQLRAYLTANDAALRGHTLADHVPVMFHIFRNYNSIQNNYQGLVAADNPFTQFQPQLIVDWQVGDVPVVNITSPLNGAVYVEGDPILFEGTAIDTEDGDISSALIWSSSLDGFLSLGSASFTRSDLSVGVHNIIVQSTDSDLNVVQDSISITVLANDPPVVAISTPPDPTTLTDTESVTFTATSIDDHDGDISSSIVWSSDLDGVLHTGATFSTNLLSIGTHVITATSTDSGAKIGTDTVGVTINFLPSGIDGRIDASSTVVAKASAEPKITVTIDASSKIKTTAQGSDTIEATAGGSSISSGKAEG